MIGIDTNILVRYLVQDDPKQCLLVNRLMNDVEKSQKSIWISQITLCESVWVLERCYPIPKQNIAETIQSLLEINLINLESDSVVLEALKKYKEQKNVDFSDCRICQQNLCNFCDFTYTFDKKASKLKGFKLLEK